jgi:hypothetical protein
MLCCFCPVQIDKDALELQVIDRKERERLEKERDECVLLWPAVVLLKPTPLHSALSCAEPLQRLHGTGMTS